MVTTTRGTAATKATNKKRKQKESSTCTGESGATLKSAQSSPSESPSPVEPAVEPQGKRGGKRLIKTPSEDEKHNTVETTKEHADKRALKLKRMREKEAARAVDAKAVNDAAGWPMPDKKDLTLRGPPERRLAKGNSFSHKKILLSVAMGVHEVKQKRFETIESKALTLKMRCPFAQAEGCKFVLDASSKKTYFEG